MKCSKCGNEFEGNFCTNCGASATPVCSNCGQEVTGKFCEKCGTPVSQPETAPVSVAEENAQPVEAPVAENTEPVQYTPAQPENTEPMQYNANQQFDQPQQPQTSYGQQFTNQSNDGFAGQQFTNQPNDGFTGQQFTNQPANNAPAPNGKKGMSTGKIVGLIIAGVATLFVILCIIIGVVIVKTIKSFNDDVDTYFDESSYDYSFDYDYDTYSDILSDDTYDSSSESSDDDDAVYEDEYYGNFDEASSCYYKYVDGGVKITEYDQPYDIKSNVLEVKLPDKIEGLDVVEIEYLGIFDLYTQDVTIKVIIPGSVDVIRSYSLSFLDEIDEVVIEDGVEVIEENAFISCDELKKVTVPASVITMDGCGLGLDLEDDYITTEKIDDFVMYVKKGSVAEDYCKAEGLNYKNK